MWLPILSAILGIIAFLPVNPYPAAFIFLVPLFLFFLKEKKLWRLVLGAALFRLIFLCGTVYFTLEPILWTEVILLALALPVVVFLFKKFFRLGSPTSNWKLDFQVLVFLPFAWTFFDLLSARFALIPTYIITAGNALGSSPLLGLASVGGLVTLTFFVALINVLLAALITWRSNRQVMKSLSVVIIATLLVGWQISIFELHKNADAYANLPNSINIAVISANDSFNADQFKQLKQELSERQSDFIIFPEDIFDQPASSSDNSPLLGNNSTPVFQHLAQELQTDIIVGYDTLQTNGTSTLKYGSAILFNEQGGVIGIHNKNRLTFIGEYWPFGSWQPSIYKWLREQSPEIGTYAIFDPGNADHPGVRNLLSAPFQKSALFAAPICLEIQYPYDLKEYRANGAQFIVNPSSNRWISGGVGLSHFLYLTDNLKKIESVWLKVPVISSGVDDFAGITLPDGQTNLVNYQIGGKNYNVFFGELRY